MMSVTDRITKYLLRRLRREGIRSLYRRAELAGLMDSTFIVQGDDRSGQLWSVTAAGNRLLSDDAQAGKRGFARVLCRATPPADADEDDLTVSGGVVLDSVRSASKGKMEQGTQAAPVATPGLVAHLEQLRRVRQHLAPPPVAGTALALLLARAIGDRFTDVGALLESIGRKDVMVMLRAPVASFERLFALALERDLILPFKVNLVDGFGGQGLTGRFRDNDADRHRMITFSGTQIRDRSEDVVRDALTRALLTSSAPVLLVDEGVAVLPRRVTVSADVVLTSPGIDRILVVELMHVCLGIAPKSSLAILNDLAVELRHLGIDDLVAAFRRNRSAQQIITILVELDTLNALESDVGKDDRDKVSKTRRDNARKTPDPTFEVVQPVSLDGDGASPTKPDRLLLVEELAGYGDARNWALDLKADLVLWRDGKLLWSEMSTKLLLSGPPGTGKTTFAKALCNSLQVPMLATSVAQWLEPGYLGDVLKLMSSAFETARKHAPAILFIDEADGIGRRGDQGRSYAEYWDSVVNRALELLDGVGKSEGVIVVGATNSPNKIDPALRRSGRLERHIVIPQPDTAALSGILAHHLGGDLTRVIESRMMVEAEDKTPVETAIIPPATSERRNSIDNQKGARS